MTDTTTNAWDMLNAKAAPAARDAAYDELIARLKTSKVVSGSNTVVPFAERGELRKSPRKRVLKGGTIAFNGLFSGVPCTIRDISEGGARMKVDSTFNVPQEFELVIDLDGLELRCDVVWRRGQEIGVRFLAPPRRVEARRIQVISGYRRAA